MEDFYEKRATVNKGFDGLKISIPGKVCLICLFNLAFLSTFLYFAIFKDVNLTDFKNLDTFNIVFRLIILFLIAQSVFTFIYRSLYVEEIHLNKQILEITNNFLGFKKTKTYNISDISDFELIDNKIIKKYFMNLAKFSFNHKKKNIRFAYNIPYNEAVAILKQIKSAGYIPEEKFKKSEDDWRINNAD